MENRVDNYRFVRPLKFFIPMTLLGFMIWSIGKDWEQVLFHWQNFRIAPLTLAFLLLILVYPEAAFSWYILLSKMEIKRKLKDILYIWIIANTSRYIPGTIWQFISKVGLAQKVARIPKKDSSVSALGEIFFGLAGASLVSFFSLPFWKFVKVEYVWLIVFMPVVFLVFHPAILSHIIKHIAYVLKKDLGRFNFRLGFLDTLLMTFLSMLNFILNGVAIFLLLRALGVSLGVEMVAVISGFYALSWIIGYVSIFAPGGMGVTEVSLAYLLSNFVPFPLASLVSLLYRVLLTLAEVLVFIFFYRFAKLPRHD